MAGIEGSIVISGPVDGPHGGMLIELRGYNRPVRLASVTTTSGAEISGTLTFEPVPGGALMRWAWVVQPKRLLRLLEPAMARAGRRQEREIWTSLKRYLEAMPGA